jgi:hypothetical protein
LNFEKSTLLSYPTLTFCAERAAAKNIKKSVIQNLIRNDITNFCIGFYAAGIARLACTLARASLGG